MKCYVHQSADAIGVCSECGQGVCDNCAVRMGGKLYCKADADRVFSKRKYDGGPLLSRPMRVSISTVLFLLYGAVGVGLGVIFVVGGFATGLIASIPVYSLFNTGVAFASLGLLGFGSLLLAMGVFSVVSGVWLWRMQIWGAAAGSVLLIMGMVIAAFIVFASPVLVTYELLLLVWGINFTMLVLLIGSWGKLGPASSEDFIDSQVP